MRLAVVKEWAKTKQAGYIALALILFAGTMTRLVSEDLPVMSDDAIYLFHAKEILIGSRPYEDFFLAHPPLELYLIALSYRLFGVGILQGRLVTLLFSLASMPLLFVVARHFYGFRPALFSLLVFSLAPGVILYTKFVWLSALPLFFCLLSSYLFLRGAGEGKNSYLLLSGVSAGFAMAVKFTSIPLLLTIIVFGLVRRVRLSRLLMVLFGFLAVFLPVFAFSFSQSFIDQVFLYHASKGGFDMFSRIKLTFICTIGFFPILVIYGGYGVGKVISSKDRSDADIFYSVNAFIAFLMPIVLHYGSPIIPSLYLVPSVYAFSLLSQKFLSSSNAIISVFFLWFFITTTLIADVSFFTCYPKSAGALMDDIRNTIDYVSERSAPQDLIMVNNYPLYYVPLLSDLHVSGGKSADITTYRFLYDLDRDSLIEAKRKAKYLIVYENNTENAKLTEVLLTEALVEPDSELSAVGREVKRIFLENTTLEARFHDTFVYRNNGV